MREPELLGERKSLADGDHGNAEDHVVANFNRLACARASAMHDLLAHLFQNRLRCLECLALAAAHECQRAGFAAACAARYRRIDSGDAMVCCQWMGLLGAFDLDGGAVYEQ